MQLYYTLIMIITIVLANKGLIKLTYIKLISQAQKRKIM